MPLHQISVTPAERSKRVQDKAMRHEPKEMMHTMSPTPHSVPERCASRASTLSYNKDFCRICHCDGDNDTPLISPCQCAGSLRFVHQSCLQQWIKSSDIKCCELCKFTFIMQTKTKPFSMWEKLDMASSERRKLLCSVAFHVVALTCVVWSLYVLIERTTEEVQSGILEWPFWTKLIVVAIGVTGGVVFMYVQCKVYVQLCRRWRAYNRVIYVQNVPEKTLPADLEAGRGRLSMCDSRSVLENSFPSIDGCHWPLAASVDQSRRTSDDRRASDAVRWPLAAALDQSRRASEDVHGRVHVTIERSSSSSPMLPPGDVLTGRQLVFSPGDGVRSSLTGSPDRSTSSCAIIPSSSDCSEMNPTPPIAVDAQS